MKHFLHILVLTLILAFPLRVCADTVTFDFTTDGGLNALGIEKPKQGKAANHSIAKLMFFIGKS